MKLPPKWKSFLPEQEERLDRLQAFLEKEELLHTIYPEKQFIFRALEVSPEDVRVVILGQDPYHRGQADGRAFSVSGDFPLPPSLHNIFKELQDDIGGSLRKDGDPQDWQDQGVLLLNRTLTVRAGRAASHRGQGWEEITSDIVYQLSQERRDLVFLLLGRQAGEAQSLIDAQRHKIIKAPHPSPLSAYRGFFGSRVWSKINSSLARPIKWS